MDQRRLVLRGDGELARSRQETASRVRRRWGAPCLIALGERPAAGINRLNRDMRCRFLVPRYWRFGADLTSFVGCSLPRFPRSFPITSWLSS